MKKYCLEVKLLIVLIVAIAFWVNDVQAEGPTYNFNFYNEKNEGQQVSEPTVKNDQTGSLEEEDPITEEDLLDPELDKREVKPKSAPNQSASASTAKIETPITKTWGMQVGYFNQNFKNPLHGFTPPDQRNDFSMDKYIDYEGFTAGFKIPVTKRLSINPEYVVGKLTATAIVGDARTHSQKTGTVHGGRLGVNYNHWFKDVIGYGLGLSYQLVVGKVSNLPTEQYAQSYVMPKWRTGSDGIRVHGADVFIGPRLKLDKIYLGGQAKMGYHFFEAGWDDHPTEPTFAYGLDVQVGFRL